MRKVLLEEVADVGVFCGPTRLMEEAVGMFGVEKELRVCVGRAAMNSRGWWKVTAWWWTVKTGVGNVLEP